MIEGKITNEQASQWIEQHRQKILPDPEVRAQYYQKNGMQVNNNTEADLEKEDQYENSVYYLQLFTPSTSAQIRERYLSKLKIFNNVENVRKKNQHLFILDWDDTILCTSFLSSIKFLELNAEAKNVLKKLDDSALKLVTKITQKNCDVYIITNAAKGWVEYSSKIYLPFTHEFLTNSDIKVISARERFGEEFPGDYGRWKTEAFKSILNNMDKNLLTNFICIGDSNIEMEAAHVLNKEFSLSLVKTVKFRENPKPDELIKQQELVYERMKEIFNSTKNLTIRLERKQSSKDKDKDKDKERT